MQEYAVELNALLWAAGWLVAVLLLFAVGLRLPLATGLGGVRARLYAASCVVAGLGVWGLANVALVLNDTHIDLTREKVYTPSADAMAVVDELRTPVHIIYFYRSEDPIGRRARNILEVMGRRNPLLTVLTVDPDKQPELARREGIRLYNAAIVEAAGRRVLIQAPTKRKSPSASSACCASVPSPFASSRAMASSRWTASSSIRTSRA